MRAGLVATMADELELSLAEFSRAAIGVAFVSRAGLDEIEASLVEFMERGGRARVLTGVYLSFTEPSALEALCSIAERYADDVFACRVMPASVPYHKKMYLFHAEAGHPWRAYIGSANLTRSLLAGSSEATVRLDHARSLPIFREVLNSFDEDFASALPLRRELVTTYREAYEGRRDERGAIETPPDIGPEPPLPRLRSERVITYFVEGEVSQATVDAVERHTDWSEKGFEIAAGLTEKEHAQVTAGDLLVLEDRCLVSQPVTLNIIMSKRILPSAPDGPYLVAFRRSPDTRPRRSGTKLVQALRETGLMGRRETNIGRWRAVESATISEKIKAVFAAT